MLMALIYLLCDLIENWITPSPWVKFDDTDFAQINNGDKTPKSDITPPINREPPKDNFKLLVIDQSLITGWPKADDPNSVWGDPIPPTIVSHTIPPITNSTVAASTSPAALGPLACPVNDANSTMVISASGEALIPVSITDYPNRTPLETIPITSVWSVIPPDWSHSEYVDFWIRAEGGGSLTKILSDPDMIYKGQLSIKLRDPNTPPLLKKLIYQKLNNWRKYYPDGYKNKDIRKVLLDPDNQSNEVD